MRSSWKLLTAVLLTVAVAATYLEGQERVAVVNESGTPVVAVEVLVALDPGAEGEEREGLAYLAARSALASVRPALDSLGVVSDVVPEKDAIGFSIIAAPEVWEEASRRLISALFREPPDYASVVAERADLVASLRGRAANPADAAVRELDRAFYGDEHPWSRPEIGTPASVERLTAVNVERFLSENFTPDRAIIAVVGPVDVEEARRHVRTVLGTVFPAPIRVVDFEPAAEPVRRNYDAITTWVSAAYPFPETADIVAIEFVFYLAADALSFSPARSSIFDVWSDITIRAGGGEARLQIVVPPEEAEEWAEELRSTVARIATDAMHEDVFESHRRRFAGERIMRMLAPEDRARAAARQLLVRGEHTKLENGLATMTQARVRAAAGALGSPAIIILGPTVD